jgi:hypothetical protein
MGSPFRSHTLPEVTSSMEISRRVEMYGEQCEPLVQLEFRKICSVVL